ncbi:MAG: DUF2723 domain-containing protein [Muribaculaceae bacterium]|nr:DUF2723 domain-containing protein [Muribaculaceae bacterium]
MKKYNLINNVMGWLIFLVAAVTYMLTIEPTASFWDCPEFIAQGYKLEIGHPPGNPMFILAARFAANFAGGDVAAVAKCVNAMSAILSAATILLLFWTITHLVKKLVVKKGEEENMSLAQYLVVMGSGVCGALAYTWSDTFWFSAVEAEVYAFSSFCTALVFWLILKWENRADDPSSDRYLILIAFIFGISLGVHLLNLLAIPAIALIFYYRKTKNSTVKGSLLTLLISFALIVLILYGLEPGFVKMSGYFERFFVNSMHMSYNSGVIFYAVLLMASFVWALFELHRDKSESLKRVSIILSVLLSGMFMIGSGGTGITMACLLIIALVIFFHKFSKRISPRIYSNIILSMMMIFIGFSCYALVLIRSNANLPLDENSPNSPFALTSYLSRDQYGKSPLVYGNTFMSPVVDYKEGPHKYTRLVKTDKNQPDEYIDLGPERDYKYASETEMLFPRIHSYLHANDYASILGYNSPQEIGNIVNITYTDKNGSTQTGQGLKPTMVDNLQFFFGYQLHHMYWRYFMWNFAGRQNDIASMGPGDVARGNWLSGIPALDNTRLNNLEYVPDEFGENNKGHNVFYMLPLLLGLIGLLWQAFSGKKGIEQFWVVFFLFFMTGIAIVMYLNQTPSQPRERDYAYAGSFYAYAIWIGMGVAGLWKCAMALIGQKKETSTSGIKNEDTTPDYSHQAPALAMAAIAAIIGLAVPLQMVSQTWDDHDRSGRYCARDFGENYLQSLDKDAIVFCNGDNDTFPLWYLQEVEGVRTDVRAVNLSYLSTDWYIAQMQRASYDSKPLPMYAGPTTYAYDKRQGGAFKEGLSGGSPIPIETLLKNFYSDKAPKDENDHYVFSSTQVLIPTNLDAAIKAGVLPESMRDRAIDNIPIDIYQESGGGLSASQTMTLDLVASSIAQGWKRPVYFASTVPESLYMGLRPYMLSTGLCYQVTPALLNDEESEIECNTDKMYNIVTTKFKWGGLDKAPKGSLYLDETTMRMVSTMRLSMMSLARSLTIEGIEAGDQITDSTSVEGKEFVTQSGDRFKKAEHILDLMEEKMPAETAPYQNVMGLRLAQFYADIYKYGHSETARKKATAVLEREVERMAQYCIFYESMDIDDIASGNLTDQDRNMVQATTMMFDIYREVNPEGFDNFVNKYASVEKSGKKPSKEMVQTLSMSKEDRDAFYQQQVAEEQARREADAQIQMEQMQAPDQEQAMSSFNSPGVATEPEGINLEDEN